LAGKTLAQDSMSVEIPSRKSEKIKTLNLQEQIQKVGANNLLTWLKLEVGGKIVSENLILLALPKELKLLNPKLTASVKESGGGFLVTIKSENPALWVWLDLENADAKYADNFFHLPPGALQTILVQPEQPLGKDDFIQQLQVRSLFDTYLPT
jgi:beta-galactosidase/beta-glucuronidase